MFQKEEKQRRQKRNERPPNKAIIRITRNAHKISKPSQTKPNQTQTKPNQNQYKNLSQSNQINMKSIIIFTAAILPFSSHANVSDGICTKIYEPVLCISDVFWNLCFAELASFDSSANCTLYALRSSLFFCTSTRTSKDRRNFSNICLAIEAGFDSGNCGSF